MAAQRGARVEPRRRRVDGVILNRPTNALLHSIVPEIDYEAPPQVLADRKSAWAGPWALKKVRGAWWRSRSSPWRALERGVPGLWHVSDRAAA